MTSAMLRLWLSLAAGATLNGQVFGQCLEWLPLPTDSAPQSSSMRLVYDAARHRVVALGSHLDQPPLQLFEFTGRAWIERTPVVRPPGARYAFGACYHAGRGTVMMYGGYVGLFNGKEQNDLWEWDGTLWTEIRHDGPWPTATGEAHLVYDPGRQRLILLATQTSIVGVALYHTWEWTGAAWERGPNLSPTSDYHRDISFAFDEFRGRGLVTTQSENGKFAVQDEVWEYTPGSTASAGAWRKVSRYPASIAVGQYGLDGAELVYDPFRRQMLRHGGRNVMESPSTTYWPSTDYWDPTEGAWKPLPGLTVPGELRRVHHGLCFDRDLGEIVLYGGGRQDFRPNDAPKLTEYRDTWRMIRSEPGFVVDLATSASWCTGQNGVLAATVAGSAELQWYRDGDPIPGATGPILVVNGVTAAHAGRYQLWARNACGEIASRGCRVSVILPPTITRQPVGPEAVCPEDTLTMEGPEYDGSVSELELQRRGADWQRVEAEFQFLAGRSFVSLLHARPADSGWYRFQVRNECATVYSQEFHVQVGAGILAEPSDVVSLPCEPVSFSVTAAGVGPLRYQWRRNGVPIPPSPSVEGTTSPSFRIHSVINEDEGGYDVVVSDACRPTVVVTSRVAQLTLKPGAQWVRRSGQGPSRRHGHAMAYDAKRGVTLLFGGHDEIPNHAQIATSNDLWEWDGDRWRLRQSRTVTTGWTNDPTKGWQLTYRERPVQRADHNLVYDAARDRLVLFGGQASTPEGRQHFLNDLWEWDGENWHFRSTNGPQSRIHASMAYDPTRERIVLMGGFLAGSNPSPTTDPAPGTVWEWDGVQWTAILPPDGPPTNYSQDAGALAYVDFGGSQRGALFGPVVGSNKYWDFLLWNGSVWQSLQTATVNSAVMLQLASSYYGEMVFDSNRGRLIWFGGQFPATPPPTALFGDKGANDWKLLVLDPDFLVPKARSRHAMVYDSKRRAVVMFGGDISGSATTGTNDTWELRQVDRPVIVDPPVTQIRQRGETMEFRVSAVGRGPLNYRWLKDGLPVLEGPRIGGTAKATLTITGITEVDVGRYEVLVGNGCGVTPSPSAWLALGSQLQVFNAHETGVLAWSIPNAVLEHAPSAVGPWSAIHAAQSPFDVAMAGGSGFYRLRLP